MRGPKPKSENSPALRMSAQKSTNTRCSRCRYSGFFSSTLSRWRRRSSGGGVAPSAGTLPLALRGAWRSHSISRASHRLRCARPARPSAAFSSAVRSQGLPSALGNQLNAARWHGPARTARSARRRRARPRSCRRRCPACVPCGVASRVQLVYSKDSPGLSSGWWPTTARPRTSSTWPVASVMIQCRATSCAAMSPLLWMVTV